LRHATTQCGRTYFDVIHDAVLHRAVTDEECPDILASIADAASLAAPLPAEVLAAQARHDNSVGLRHFAPLRLPRCRLRWFTPEEACDVIAEAGNLILVGDSLVRGIVLALHAIMTQNFEFGMMRGAELAGDPAAWEECRCDGGWGGNSICHVSPPMSSTWAARVLAPQAAHVCPRWGLADRLHYLTYAEPNEEPVRPERLAEILSSSDNGRSTVYSSEGFGWLSHPYASARDIDTAEAMRSTWAPLLNLSAAHGGTRLLVGTVMAQRGAMGYPAQEPASLARYNDWLRRLAQGAGLELLEGAALTAGRFSRDGVHYGSHDNVAFAQVLLNVLAADARGRQAAGAREHAAPAPAPARPGAAPWAHGLRRFFRRGPTPHPGLVAWLSPSLHLRGCRCWRDWRSRSAANASASLCWCRGACPPEVSPEFLTFAAARGCANGGAHERGEGLCAYSCERLSPEGRGAWEATGCGGGEGPPCERPPPGGAPCAGCASAQGECHALCGGRAAG